MKEKNKARSSILVGLWIATMGAAIIPVVSVMVDEPKPEKRITDQVEKDEEPIVFEGALPNLPALTTWDEKPAGKEWVAVRPSDPSVEDEELPDYGHAMTETLYLKLLQADSPEERNLAIAKATDGHIDHEDTEIFEDHHFHVEYSLGRSTGFEEFE